MKRRCHVDQKSRSALCSTRKDPKTPATFLGRERAAAWCLLRECREAFGCVCGWCVHVLYLLSSSASLFVKGLAQGRGRRRR